MSFTYESLKQISGTEIISGSVTSSNIASNTVNSTNIASGAVQSGNIASGAVTLNTGGIVTGTLQIAHGGLANTGFGSANQMFSGAGSYRNYGIYGITVFTSSGTYYTPSGVRFVKVCVQGGGGGASGHGESGGAGGYAELVLDVRSISSVSVTIGGDSGSSFYSGAGSQGNSASFGPYVSASGGYGANQNYQHCGGLGGVGSGGNLNLYGAGGANHHQESGIGGGSFWGGSVAGGHPNGGNFSHNHQSHSAPGSGGSGGYFHGHYGSQGKAGMIVVYQYY